MKMTRILFWILGLLAIALFVRLWAGTGSYPDIWDLEKQIDVRNADNDQQAETNRELEAELKGLNQDDEAVEDHARSELGMIKEHETFYQVILSSDPKAPLGPPPQDKDKGHVE